MQLFTQLVKLDSHICSCSCSSLSDLMLRLLAKKNKKIPTSFNWLLFRFWCTRSFSFHYYYYYIYIYLKKTLLRLQFLRLHPTFLTAQSQIHVNFGITFYFIYFNVYPVLYSCPYEYNNYVTVFQQCLAIIRFKQVH